MREDQAIRDAVMRLDFLSGMLLAWDENRVEIDETILDGWWYMIECIKRDLEQASLKRANTTTTTNAA